MNNENQDVQAKPEGFSVTLSYANKSIVLDEHIETACDTTVQGERFPVTYMVPVVTTSVPIEAHIAMVAKDLGLSYFYRLHLAKLKDDAIAAVKRTNTVDPKDMDFMMEMYREDHPEIAALRKAARTQGATFLSRWDKTNIWPKCKNNRSYKDMCKGIADTHMS